MRLWQLPETGFGQALPPERGAFVLLGGKGVAERKFDTLAEAVQRAIAGDTIEIRGDGPFVSEAINIQSTAVTIRAGERFRPVLRFETQSWEEASGIFTACIKTNAPLVLEGLEFGRLNPPPKVENFKFFVCSSKAPLHVANCRFLTPHETCIQVVRSPLCVVRNCELLNGDASSVSGNQSSGGQWIIDNCLQVAKTPLRYFQGSDDAEPHGGSIQLTRSSLVANRAVWHDLSKVSALPDGGQNFKPIRLEVSGRILAADTVLTFNQDERFHSLKAAEAETMLAGLLDWQGHGNLYGDNLLRWSISAKPLPPHGPQSLADWKKFWTSSETDSLQGRVRFQGGDLLSRVATAPETITPEDFRLRSDSPGYRAGPDGKDLGADVDLVGPGEAYERWKQTPEYQEWLEHTGQQP